MKKLFLQLFHIFSAPRKSLTKWEASEDARAKNENAKFKAHLERLSRR